jgi:hypothetical protein
MGEMLLYGAAERPGDADGAMAKSTPTHVSAESRRVSWAAHFITGGPLRNKKPRRERG